MNATNKENYKKKDGHDQQYQDATLIMWFVGLRLCIWRGMWVCLCVFVSSEWCRAESCLFVVAVVATLNLLGTGGFMVRA